MATRKVKIELEVDSKGGVIGVRKLDGSLKKLEKTTTKTGKKAFDLGGAFQTMLGNLAAGAVSSAIAGLQRLARAGFRFLSESVGLAGIQDIAERKLEQALKNVGDESADSAAELAKVARELQKVSNFGDETIITAQALLLSFGEVGGKEGAALLSKNLVDTAAGLAKTTGEAVDLNTIAQALGRALTQGAGALTRYGVSMTEAQKAQFNAAQGMEKVRLLSTILDQNFKGLAAATQDPFKQMRNAVADLREKIGSGLLPVLRKLAERVTDFVQSEDAEELAEAIGDKLGGAIDRLAFLVRENSDDIFGFFEDVSRVAKETFELLEDTFSFIAIIAKLEQLGAAGNTIKDDLVILGEAINAVRAEFGIIPKDVDATADSIDNLGDSINNTPSEFFDGKVSHAQLAGIRQFVQGLKDGSDEAKKTLETGAQERFALTEDEQRKLTQLRLDLMEEGLSRELQQIEADADKKVDAFKKEFGDKWPSVAAEIEQLVADWRERMRDEAFGLDEIINIDGSDDLGALQALLDETTAKVEAAEKAATDAVLRGAEARVAARQTELSAEERLQTSREAATKSLMESTALQVESAQEAAAAVGNAIRSEIQAYLAKAIAGAIAKEFATKGLLGAITGTAAAAAVGIAFNALIPSFRHGTDSFEGGLAQVHKDEILALPRGTSITSQNESRNLMRAAKGAPSSTGGSTHVTVSIESDIPTVVRKIKTQTGRNARTGVGPSQF